MTTAARQLELVRARLRATASDYEAVAISDIENVTRRERTFDGGDAHRQKRAATLHHCRGRAIVHRHRPVRGVAQGNPKLTGGDLQAVRRGNEKRSDGLARGKTHKRVLLGAAADDACDARRHEDSARTDLGDHAAGTHRCSGVSCRPDDSSVDFGDARDELRGGIKRWVGGIQAVDVRQGDAEISRHQAAHQGGKRIVIAKLDLIDGGGVVLVHYGNHAKLHQAREGIASMKIGRPAGGIVPGEQHKGGEQACGAEFLVVHSRKDALANRGARLQARHVGGFFSEAELGRAARDGAGAHNDEVPSQIAKLCRLAGKVRDEIATNLAVFPNQGGGTDLDDHGFALD